MARADYRAQMERHAGEHDVLPQGLVVPTSPHGTEWRAGSCRGIALLSDEALEGNRWPAVSGAILAELARRCATLGAMTVLEAHRRPRPREISVRFRKAIPVADPRRRPHVADGARPLYWNAVVERGAPDLSVQVRMKRRPGEPPADVVAVEALARFEAAHTAPAAGGDERRMADYLIALPRRLALPAYDRGWSAAEIHGTCVEPSGSLLAVAEQALGDAGKIVRGDDTPADLEESMLLADMKYRWLADIDDGCATYVARPGPRRTDEKGRVWMDASAILSLDRRPVGEATGCVVFHRLRRETRSGVSPSN
jgi:hypothetical protein